MSVNLSPWKYNLLGITKPIIIPGRFQAGATEAIYAGEILEFTGNSNADFHALDSDFAMDGHIAVATQQIQSGDLTGFYPIIVPTPYDVFEYPLASAAAVTYGAPLYYSSAQAVTTSGSYILGYAIGTGHYPDLQGSKALVGAGAPDAGTTVKSTAYVQMVFAQNVSYYERLTRGIGAGYNRVSIGDAGGFTGMVFDASGTSIQFYIDGTLTASIESTGAYTNEVS